MVQAPLAGAFEPSALAESSLGDQGSREVLLASEPRLGVDEELVGAAVDFHLAGVELMVGVRQQVADLSGHPGRGSAPVGARDQQAGAAGEVLKR